jgi:hypothetical protein
LLLLLLHVIKAILTIAIAIHTIHILLLLYWLWLYYYWWRRRARLTYYLQHTLQAHCIQCYFRSCVVAVAAVVDNFKLHARAVLEKLYTRELLMLHE